MAIRTFVGRIRILVALGIIWTAVPFGCGKRKAGTPPPPSSGSAERSATKSPTPAQKTPQAPFFDTQFEEEIEERVRQLDGEDDVLRSEAAWALLETGAPAVPFLLKGLESERLKARQVTQWILVKIGESSVDPLKRLLKVGSEEGREQAARVLGVIASESAVPALTDALNDPVSKVREAASSALKGVDAAGPIAGLVRTLREGDEDACIDAALALAELSDERALKALVETLRDERHGVRFYAAEALRKLTGKRFKRDHASWSRWHAKYLRETQTPHGTEEDPPDESPGPPPDPDTALEISRLVGILKGPGHGIFGRLDALSALEKIGPSAVDTLIGLLEDKDLFVRQYAPSGLGVIGDKRAVPALIRRLRDPHEFVRAAAAEALGKLRDPRAVGPLARACSDLNSDVRESAAEALGEIGGKASIRKLVGLLSEEEEKIWFLRVQEALVKIGNPAVDSLIAALETAGPGGRVRIVETLADIGDRRAVPALIRLLKEDEETLGDDAASALKKITNEWFGNDAEAWTRWWNEKK
jgi:HEAT repeat protein